MKNLHTKITKLQKKRKICIRNEKLQKKEKFN